MAQYFHETAHNKIDPKKYAEGIERIFGKKPEKPCPWCADYEEKDTNIDVSCGTCGKILASKKDE